MNQKSDSYPPALKPGAAVVFLFALYYAVGSLNSWVGLLYGIFFLGVGIYYVVSSQKEKQIYEKAVYEGVEIEARIVDPQSLWKGQNIVPIIYGVPYRALKVEYEVNGATFVSVQDLPDSFVNKLKGKSTLRISVNPEKLMVWVPA